MELAIDTSTRYASVGLSQEGVTVREMSWYSEQNHTVELLSAVEMLFKWAGIDRKDLTAVFVAIGPGGFSALRVGTSAAKGLVLALGIPVLGVDTLELEAFPYAEAGLPVCPLLEAGRGEVAWSLYQGSEEGWRQIVGVRIGSLAEVCDQVPDRILLCGEAIHRLGGELHQMLRGDSIVVDQLPPTRRSSTLGMLGYRRLTSGERDDMATLQPFYLRSPSISLPKSSRLS